jgi:hypothetical protein
MANRPYVERIVSREAALRVLIFERYANGRLMNGLDGKDWDGGRSVDFPLPLHFF